MVVAANLEATQEVRPNVFIDTETCGLYGMAVLLQFAFDDGPIALHSLWKVPIQETLDLIEKIAECNVIGFNLVFDWFHLCKIYTTFALAPNYDWIPEEHIEELALLEEKARLGDCLKPYSCLDLMLHARKGPFQALMAREDISVKRVPAILAEYVRQDLEKRVHLDGIYFARRKNKHDPKWKLYDCHDIETGRVNPHFKNVVLRFAASGALKVLADHLQLKPQDDILQHGDVGVHKKYRPKEYGYAPFALAVGKPGKWDGAWPEVIQRHIDHWHYHKIARQYAEDDIFYTRALYKHPQFKDATIGDDDSVLACMVAAVRWRGFKIKTGAMKIMKKAARKRYEGVPMHPAGVKHYIHEVLSKTEIAAMKGSTKKIVLEKISKSECDCVLEGENPDKCLLCHGTKLHPAANRAKDVLNARKAKKEEEIYDKLLRAGRFHASFVVIGTLSSRMAGTDKLNPQGIKHTDEVRDGFPLCDDGFVLCGGDFDAFEVVLADAAYNDPALRAALKADKKIHALFGMEMFQCSYEDVMRSKGTEHDMYTMGKQGVFAIIYGGDHTTLMNKQGIDEEVALKAYNGFIAKYPEIGKARQKIFDMFCSMRQPKAGGKVVWAEPADYIESLLGFRRYFTLENKICKALFDLGENPPEEWKKFKVRIVRRQDKGAQLVEGATRSALFGAAFAIQAAAMRAAANHVIQSSGATITKRVQRRVWDVQPHGVQAWRVMPLNVHDEILTPTRPQYVDEVKQIVHDTVETFRERVPLIKMEWETGLESWSKGMTEGKVKRMRKLQSENMAFDEICRIMKFKDGEMKEKATLILEGKAWDWIS